MLCSYLRFGKLLHNCAPLGFGQSVIQQRLQSHGCYFRHTFCKRRGRLGNFAGNVRAGDLGEQAHQTHQAYASYVAHVFVNKRRRYCPV